MVSQNETKPFNEYAERFLAAIEALGLSDYKVWNSLPSLSKGTMSKIRTGRTGASKNVLNEFASIYTEVSPAWLLTGKGSMLRTEEHAPPSLDSNVHFKDGSDYVFVEFVDLRASAGTLGVSTPENLPYTKKRLVPRAYSDGNCFVVAVDGDSMDDGTSRSLEDGDEILIREVYDYDTLPIRKALFCITSRNGNVIKQILEFNRKEGYVLCHSFNPQFEDFRIDLEDVYQIFQVIQIVKKRVTLG